MSLYSIRTLVGLAEGGFLPGVLLYLTLWFPQAHRARANALFEQPRAQVPIVVFRGSPIVINTLGLRHLFYFSRGSFRSDREIERRALIGLGVGPYPATVPPQHLLCRGKADARSRKLGVLM